MSKGTKKTSKETVTEGTITLVIPRVDVVSRAMGTFYNREMQFSRDLTILLLRSIKRKITVADPLAATGVRSMRMLKECKNVQYVCANDIDAAAVRELIRNCKRNTVSYTQVKSAPETKKAKRTLYITNTDANEFLLQSYGFDYIEIDPFGSPNPFLDAAIKRIAREGYLGVTATDTAPLCGTYEQACKRKYDAMPLRNFMMHEVGLRILIRKVQLIGAQYDKALTPVLAYSKEHYFRIFFRCEKGKSDVDKMLTQHKYLLFCRDCFAMRVDTKNVGICTCTASYTAAGPLWTGELADEVLIEEMQQNTTQKELRSFLALLGSETKTATPFVYDISKIAKKEKCTVRKIDDIVTFLLKRKYAASRTHMNMQAIRTNAPVNEIVTSLKEEKK